MNIGSNIKRRRYELRMSQQELADAMGYRSRSTIAKIESGENDVSHKKLQRFAAVLDTTVEQLVAGYSTPLRAEETPTDGGRKNKNIAIILAGGKSGRNLQNIPNQFIHVHGKPILVYCMEVYQAHPSIDDIYVVCLKGWEKIVSTYADRYRITKLKGLIPGGASGILSLKNAVEQIRDRYAANDLILIQESTRPMVTAETISRLLQACEENSSATICHSMGDYIQFDLSGAKPRYMDRNGVIAMQSPEAHRLRILKKAFQKAVRSNHPLSESCCTMLLYNLGFEINFIEYSINNIKITREADIAAFGALVRERH